MNQYHICSTNIGNQWQQNTW